VKPARSGAPSRAGPALHTGITAALTWVAAEALGLPDLVGAPFLPLLPVALGLGMLVGLTRRARLIDWCGGFLVLVILVTAYSPLLPPRVHALIESSPIPAEGADAVVVLSASVSRDGLLSPGGAERLLHGVELLRDGASAVLITSRVRHVSRRDTLTSDGDQARLVALAPDSIRWEVVDSVATTRDEAVRIAALAHRNGWRQVIVVTSPMHTRRACAAVRHAGLTVTCVAAPSRGVAVRTLTTASDRLAAFGPWLYETVGWWWYGVRGWR